MGCSCGEGASSNPCWVPSHEHTNRELLQILIEEKNGERTPEYALGQNMHELMVEARIPVGLHSVKVTSW